MKLGHIGLLLVAGCFHPATETDVPCAENGACPGSQQCDHTRSPPLCVERLADASLPDHALVDARPTDAPGMVADGSSGLGPWGAPVKLPIAASGDDDPTLTGDLLELYFNRANDIYVSKRAAVTAPWGTPTLVTELSTAETESTPEISLDGLTIYFSTVRAGLTAGTDIWRSIRTSRTAPWPVPTPVAELNTAATDRTATPTGDPNVLVLASNRIGSDFELFITTRVGTGPWAMPTVISATSSTSVDTAPFLSADGLTLYFFSDRGGDSDLYTSTRTSTTSPFSPPTPISELNTQGNDVDPWVSPDNRHMFFGRANTLYESTR